MSEVKVSMDGKNDIQKKSIGRKIVDIVGILLCCIFIPLIIINGIIIVKTYTNPDEMPSIFGISPVIVLSGSMEPEFSAGDMIFIRDVDFKTLAVDDVICFIPSSGSTAITHRIVDVVLEDGGDRFFVTRGDANDVDDSLPVMENEIQGKYGGLHIPGLGNLAIFMQTTVGMIIFIILPLVMFLFWDFFRRMVDSRKEAKAELDMAQELERLRAQVGTVENKDQQAQQASQNLQPIQDQQAQQASQNLQPIQDQQAQQASQNLKSIQEQQAQQASQVQQQAGSSGVEVSTYFGDSD